MKAPGLTLSRRLLVLTAVALLPALAILGFNEYSLRKTRLQEVHAYALRMSELVALEMERILTGAGALMVAVANAPTVQEGSPACRDYMNRLQASLPQVLMINITDLEGRSLCANSNNPDDLRPAASASVRAALDSEAFYVGEYYQTSAGPGLLLGTRRTAADGSISGYVLAAVGLDYLGGVLKDRPSFKDSAMTIADRNGVYLAREPLSELYVGTQVPESFLPRLQGDQPGTMQLVGVDDIERIIGFQPARQRLGLYVSAGMPLAESMAPINEATWRGLLLAAVGGLLALFLALSFGRQFIRRPVLRLLQTISAWRDGDHEARTGMSDGRGEFHQVGRAIDDLLDELAERQAAQSEAEQHRDLLARELDHRIKNLLATVQALARQSFRNSPVADETLQSFYGRLAVMANAHKLLTTRSAETADIRAVVETATGPFAGREQRRFTLTGPTLDLHGKAALSLAMALHELCTNAVKYGALSDEDGQVSVDWALTDDHRLIITWRESGGPSITAPSSTGFGSRMIERAMAADLGATVNFDYAADGLICTITAAETALADRQLPGAGPFMPVRAVAQRPEG
jgi:two-component sensor histidine kinase